MPEMSLRLPEEWARAVAARVARTIRDACGQAVDQHSHASDEIDDACDAAVTAALQVLADEFNGRDPVHDDTAIATAYARGRRDMAEEAAKVAERVRDDLFPVLNKSRYQPHEVTRFHKCSVGLVVEDIRALAASTPEPKP